MAYKFKAIEQDKEKLNMKNSKNVQANSAYGSSIIPEFNPGKAIDDMIASDNIQKINLSKIKQRNINDFAVISNQTLKKSILKIGLINPIIVRKSDNDKYVIISGHRRFNAFKDIVADAKIEKASLEKAGKSALNAEKIITKYSELPCIVFTMVDSDSELLGTNPKYITAEQEEEMYKAANLENRQISRGDLTTHIMYFYNMIKEDTNYKQQLLAENNKGAKRNATKLNIPKTLSTIITKDLGFSVAPSYIWQLVTLIESEDLYPKYHKKAMERIGNGEKVKTVFNDFKMACEIHNDNTLDEIEKHEYEIRIEKGSEKIIDIYNEAKNIKQVEVKTKRIEKEVADYFEALLIDIKNKKITPDKAIEKFKNYIS
mgnify:FL=1